MKCTLNFMFPTVVGQFDSDNHEEYKRAFFDRLPHHCIPHESGTGLISGESSGRVYIHTDPALDALFRFISRGVAAYMNELGMDTERFDINIVKTWISVTDAKTTTPFHAHATSHFSFCYYMNMPNQADALAFVIRESPNEPFYGAFGEATPRQKSMVTVRNAYNSNEAIVQPMEGQLLVFPSHLTHGTVKVGDMGSEQRTVLAGDVILVFNEENPNYATGVFDPKTWRVFK